MDVKPLLSFIYKLTLPALIAFDFESF